MNYARLMLPACAILMLAGCGAPAIAQTAPAPLPAALDLPAGAVAVDSVTPCFTLTDGMDCGKLVADTVDRAKHTLDVQAYNFTAQDIIAAIVRAKKRGVTVRVILDKISPSQQCEGADPVRNAGIPTFIDRKPKIAHNKVMVIDGNVVITGSLNFSTNAETSNAENTNVIASAALAQLYERNFENRLAASIVYDGVHAKPVKACGLTAPDDPLVD